MTDNNTHENNLARLGVGEVIICNRDTKGKFQQIPEFTGKSIIGIGGGEDKTYIIEEKDKITSEVKSIQTRENFNNKQISFDNVDKKLSTSDHINLMNYKSQNLENVDQDLNKDELELATNKDLAENNYTPDEGSVENNTNYQGKTEVNKQILQIVKGKHQLLKLVANGKVYSSGEAYYGVVGLGGAASSTVPRLIPNLANIRIKQIACGSNHSLALSTDGDMYSWGMGFEGQLGLTSRYKVASSPRYVKFFYKNPIKFLACGTNNSFCITQKDSYLYGWGENKLGQLGLGKEQIIEKPTLIYYEEEAPTHDLDSSFNINSNDKKKFVPSEKMPLKASFVSAGYAHTAVISENGPLMTMGLNIYGQLGLGHTQTTFKPQKVTKDDNDNPLGRVIKVGCNVTGTFIIVEGGMLYSCGSGDIGHGEIGVVKLPRLIYDQRIYSEIFCNNNSVVCFCPLKIISVNPNFGPCTGNTILSIIGSALKEFPKLSVKFEFGVEREVKANFDKLSKTIFVKTPNFLELCPTMVLPAKCKILVTFDGTYFTDYKDDYLIYSNSSRKPISLTPKCGPIEGGEEMQIQIDLSGIDQKYLFSLTVGFQAKPQVNEVADKKKTKMKRKNSKQHDGETSRISKQSKMSSEEKSNTYLANMISSQDKDNLKDLGGVEINPLDMNPFNPQLEKSNWYCTFGSYENGIIKCKIPKIDGFNQSTSEYFVDVSLNGQQFSGHPLTYRFYGKC